MAVVTPNAVKKAIYTALKSDLGVVAVMGSGIKDTYAPEGTAYPFFTYMLTSLPDSSNWDADKADVTFTVTAWSDSTSLAEAGTMIAAADAALRGPGVQLQDPDATLAPFAVKRTGMGGAILAENVVNFTVTYQGFVHGR